MRQCCKEYVRIYTYVFLCDCQILQKSMAQQLLCCSGLDELVADENDLNDGTYEFRDPYFRDS